MKITFLEEADSEFSAAVAYYDGSGLGQRFEDEMDRALFLAYRTSSLVPVKTGYLSADEPPYLSLLYPLCYS